MVSQLTSTINFKGYHSLVPGLISIFSETVWVPLTIVYRGIVDLQLRGSTHSALCLRPNLRFIANMHLVAVCPGNGLKYKYFYEMYIRVLTIGHRYIGHQIPALET